MKYSQQFDKVTKAILDVQSKAENPKQNKTAEVPTRSGGSYTYGYTNLDAVMASVKKLAHEAGLLILQGTGYAEEIFGLTTRIVHVESSQFVETFDPIDLGGHAQDRGASETYFRRYSIQNIFGLVSEEDTDGVGSTKPEPKAKRAPRVGTVKTYTAANPMARVQAAITPAVSAEPTKPETPAVVSPIRRIGQPTRRPPQ